MKHALYVTLIVKAIFNCFFHFHKTKIKSKIEIAHNGDNRNDFIFIIAPFGLQATGLDYRDRSPAIRTNILAMYCFKSTILTGKRDTSLI